MKKSKAQESGYSMLPYSFKILRIILEGQTETGNSGSGRFHKGDVIWPGLEGKAGEKRTVFSAGGRAQVSFGDQNGTSPRHSSVS